MYFPALLSLLRVIQYQEKKKLLKNQKKKYSKILRLCLIYGKFEEKCKKKKLEKKKNLENKNKFNQKKSGSLTKKYIYIIGIYVKNYFLSKRTQIHMKPRDQNCNKLWK